MHRVVTISTHDDVRGENTMPEIQSLNDAEDRVASLFKVSKGMPATILSDYAKIAWFFTQKPVFELALAQVSGMLWDKYRDYLWRNPGQRNLLTTAIRDVAIANGWQFDDTTNVVLVGAVTAEQYLAWTSKAQLFKDDMDLKHGEHSHSFQWLAVAAARATLNLSQTPVFLYQNVPNVLPQNKKSLIVPGFKTDSGVQGAVQSYSIWSWVADCFPTSMATGRAIPAEESLFSDTYRTPQILMQYLLDLAPADHFIGEYLRSRYNKRSWIADKDHKYDSVSGGATVKSHALIHHQQKPGWETVAGTSGPAAFTKSANPSFGAAKATVTKTFHGRKGQFAKPT